MALGLDALLYLLFICSPLAEAGRVLSSAEDSVRAVGQLERTDLPNPVALGTKYSFVHISKNAGSSLMKDAAAHMPKGVFFQGNDEKSILASKQQDTQVVLMMRHPWKLVLSLFLECKYDWWGKQVTAKTNFTHGNLSIVYDGFSDWVDHFLLDSDTNHAPGEFGFNCYNPFNFQTRFLAPHHEHDMHFPVSEEDKWPDLGRAKKEVDDAAFVGIADLYSESLCLFEFHTTGQMPALCACGDVTEGVRKGSEHHVDHDVPQHDVYDLPANILSRMYFLLEEDVPLYLYSLERFEAQAEAAYRATGIRAVCSGRAEHLQHSVNILKLLAKHLHATLIHETHRSATR